MKIARFNLLFALCLMAYEVHADAPTPEYDITSTSIVVNWFDTPEELVTEVQRLEDEYCEENECKDGPVDYRDVAALTECDYHPEMNTSFCELWLVYPTELTEWTDTPEQEIWKTIGEEFFHTLAGEFHN